MPGPSKIPPLDPTDAAFQRNDVEIMAKMAQKLALTLAQSAALLVEIAHMSRERLESADKETIDMGVSGLMQTLGSYTYGQTVLPKVEPDLLLTDVGPAKFAGIERRTAHSAAFAIAEKVYRAVSEASVVSVAPPRVSASGGKPEWDLSAVRRGLREIQPFDGAILAEMVKQEAAKMQQIRQARYEDEKRSADRATIREEHRTMRTKAEVAAMCGVNPRTVDRWIESGKLRCAEAEGKFIFDVREIELLAKKGKKPAGDP